MLITKKNELIVSDTDIRCIKLVMLCGKHKRVYKSPLALVIIPKSVILGQEPMVAEGDANPREPTETIKMFFPEYKFGFQKGLIHTYQMSELDKFGNIDGFALFECIIPKGTPYAVGLDSLGRESYASKQIRFIKRLRVKSQNSDMDPRVKKIWESLDQSVKDFVCVTANLSVKCAY